MPANYTLLYFCELIYRERIKANLNWSKKLILYFPFCEIFNILLDQLSFYFVFCWIHSDFILLDPLRFYFAGSTQILFCWIHSDFISLDPLRFYFTGSTQILFHWIHTDFILWDPLSIDMSWPQNQLAQTDVYLWLTFLSHIFRQN